MEITIKKIGGSDWFFIPHEFIKVFNLKDWIYSFEVSKNGETITYKRISKNEESVQEETEDKSLTNLE